MINEHIPRRVQIGAYGLTIDIGKVNSAVLELLAVIYHACGLSISGATTFWRP
jgi:hypothetical protein